MSTLIRKTCSVCGTDVSQLKRTKDDHGNYFCAPCWQANAKTIAAEDLSHQRPRPGRPVAPPVTTAARIDEEPLPELSLASRVTQMSTPATRRKTPLWRRIGTLIAIVIVAGCITVGACFVFVLKPENAKIQRMWKDIRAQESNTELGFEENENRAQYLLHLRIMAEQARAEGKADAFLRVITDNGRLGFREAIVHDPIVGPLAKARPQLIDTIRSGDDSVLLAYLLNLTTVAPGKVGPGDELSGQDEQYTHIFGTAIASLASNQPPADASTSGLPSAPDAHADAVQRNNNDPKAGVDESGSTLAQILKRPFADIQVAAEWGTLDPTAMVYTTVGNGWDVGEVPPELEGAQFTRFPMHHKLEEGKTTFTIEKPGAVLLGCTPNWGKGGGGKGSWKAECTDQATLEQQGWKAVARARNWVIFYRECRAGETFTIRTEKYNPPILIRVSTAP
jgi:hypothetical protein